MAKKLYVGNLPYTVKDEDLNQLFSQAGAVESAVIINDRATGRSKGFGFVEMSNDDEAQKAIDMFNSQEIEGRKLTVNEARPMQPREDRGGFRG
ncbi:MAG: RNA-binding protein [Candidatus Moraniibacteriota bacterium]